MEQKFKYTKKNIPKEENRKELWNFEATFIYPFKETFQKDITDTDIIYCTPTFIKAKTFGLMNFFTQ